MGTRPAKGSIGRPGASIWSLLIPLWVYAALVGVLAAAVGRLLAPNEALQWTATAALVVVAGVSFAGVFGRLRRLTRTRR
jgi:hypothetical protein